MSTPSVVWCDQRGKRGRHPWLLLIKDDIVHSFEGETIPGVVAVVGRDYEKNGKWSCTTYRLAVASGVRIISGLDGWNTDTFREGLKAALQWPNPLDRWHDLANALKVSISAVQSFLRTFRPKEAEELDRVEEDLATLDETVEDGADVVAISFGNPMLKEIRAGFWDWPIRILDKDGYEVGQVLRPNPTLTPHVWEARGNVRIIAAERKRGHHGGYWSFRLAVPAGCRAVHEQ